MNVFIVVRPSLCTEGSLESTLHDASRVAALFYVHFAARLARRMIARTQQVGQFDAASASAGIARDYYDHRPAIYP